MSEPTLAYRDCYGCKGTGRTVGWWPHDGKRCPCIASCEDCGADFAWTHDDERPPSYCQTCRAENDKLDAE